MAETFIIGLSAKSFKTTVSRPVHIALAIHQSMECNRTECRRHTRESKCKREIRIANQADLISSQIFCAEDSWIGADTAICDRFIPWSSIPTTDHQDGTLSNANEHARAVKAREDLLTWHYILVG